MKNKIYKQWWFWLIVLIILAFLITTLTPHTISSNKNTTQNVNVEIPKEIYCEADEDCVITLYSYNCCPLYCAEQVVNKEELEKRKEWTANNCKPEDKIDCPIADCSTIQENPTCENNICISKIIRK